MKTFEIKKFYQADLQVQIKGYEQAQNKKRELIEKKKNVSSEISELAKMMLSSKRSGNIDQQALSKMESLKAGDESIKSEIRKNEIRTEMYRSNLERIILNTVKQHLSELPQDKKLNKRHFDKVAKMVSEQLGIEISINRKSGTWADSVVYYSTVGDVRISDTIYSVIGGDGFLQDQFKKVYVWDIIHDVEKNVERVVMAEKQISELEEQLEKAKKEMSEYKYHNTINEQPLNRERV